MVKAPQIRTALGAALAAALGVPAFAQDRFDLPADCAAYVSIQSRDCTVSHLFTCESDAEGHQHRVDFDRDGMTYLGEIDGETQWISSYSPRSGSTATLLSGAADPASFSELLARGLDGFDFSTISNVFGETHHVGEDRLTGEVEVIDGVSLQVTNFVATAYDSGGAVIYRSEGQEYINADWRTFIGGLRIVTVDGAASETDGRPAAFDFPGDAGFLTTRPQFGCDTVLSMLEARP